MSLLLCLQCYTSVNKQYDEFEIVFRWVRRQKIVLQIVTFDHKPLLKRLISMYKSEESFNLLFVDGHSTRELHFCMQTHELIIH